MTIERAVYWLGIGLTNFTDGSLEQLTLQGALQIQAAAVLFIYCQQGQALHCGLPSGKQWRFGAGQGLLLEQEPGPYQLRTDGQCNLLLAR